MTFEATHIITKQINGTDQLIVEAMEQSGKLVLHRFRLARKGKIVDQTPLFKEDEMGIFFSNIDKIAVLDIPIYIFVPKSFVCDLPKEVILEMKVL